MNLFLPNIAHAATTDTLSNVMTKVVVILTEVLFLLLAVAVVVFVVQVIRYYILPNEDRKKAGLYVMYSIIGFFVILSLWGIVNILGNTIFGVGQGGGGPGSWADFANIFPR